MSHENVCRRLTPIRVLAVLLLVLSGAFFPKGTGILASDGLSPHEILTAPEAGAVRAAFAAGDWAEARALVETLCQETGDYPAPGLLMAWLHLTHGDRPEFESRCAEVIDQRPNDPQVWYVLTESALADGRWIEASLLLERGDSLLAAMSDSGEHPQRTRALQTDSLFLAARLAEAQGKYSLAEEKYRFLRDQDPQNDSYALRLGSVLLEEGKTDEAVRLFDAARELNRQNLPGWLIAADLLHRRGKREEAGALVDNALGGEMSDDGDAAGEDPERVYLLSEIVRLLLKWNRLEEAEKWIAKIPSSFSVGRTLAGRLALFQEDYSRAEKEFRQAQLAGRDDFETLNGYILALAELDEARLRQAHRLAEDMVKKYPRADEAAATLGWIEFLLGETDAAWKRLETILNAGSFTPTEAYYMAETALDRGDTMLCETLLDLALEQGDNFPKRQAAEKLRQMLRGSDAAEESAPEGNSGDAAGAAATQE
ncbi:MAG: tetratricopeptide repeat protein [Thermoguttaceae bacterium]|nr:tetratricopeptide repeat protein [Thermoguttaceae bacterium]